MKMSWKTMTGLAGLGLLVLGLAQACSATGDGTDDGGGGSGANGTGAGQTGTGGGMGAFTSTGGGGGVNVGGGCAETSSEAQQGLLPADIIVAVDNSGSMSEEADEVQASMNDFAAIIIGSGIDAHIVVISSDSTDEAGVCVPAPLGSGTCPNDENLPIYRHVNQEVASSNSFELILSTYDQWKDSLRPNASRTVAVISDDNSAMDAVTFAQQLIALDPSFQGFKFDAIVSPYELPNPMLCFNCNDPNACFLCDPCCGKNAAPWPPCIDLPAEEGTVYKELVAQTGGVLGDLCAQIFVPVFIDMATAVVSDSQVACVYNIPDPGGGQEIDYDKVNVDYQPHPNDPAEPIYYVPGGAPDCGPEGGWYYDNPASPSQILLCPATCDYVQLSGEGKVAVKFGCETLTQPPT